MKKSLIGLLVCLLLVSVASAEVLMTANPIGKGKVSVSLGAKLDQNYFDMGNISMLCVDALQYGINDKLDLYASTGIGFSQKATDKPRTMDALTMSFGNVGLKYTLVNEDPNGRRVSIAVNGAIKAGSNSKPTMNNWQYVVGVLASKRVNNFNPYLGVNYRLTKQTYGDYSQVDYTLGTGIGPADRMVIIEDTVQSVDFAGANFLSNQIALAFTIGLN
jgi:hypothetical protein